MIHLFCSLKIVILCYVLLLLASSTSALHIIGLRLSSWTSSLHLFSCPPVSESSRQTHVGISWALPSEKSTKLHSSCSPRNTPFKSFSSQCKMHRPMIISSLQVYCFPQDTALALIRPLIGLTSIKSWNQSWSHFLENFPPEENSNSLLIECILFKEFPRYSRDPGLSQSPNSFSPYHSLSTPLI